MEQEDRIKQLELVTKRLTRRAHKKITGIITPYPISNAVEGDNVKGTILKYMFPCDGKITKGMIRLDPKPKKWVDINVKIFNDTTSSLKGFMISKKIATIEPDLDIVAGDCLELVLVPHNEDIVKEIWVSLLWKPLVKEIEAKSFLITELENDLSKE